MFQVMTGKVKAWITNPVRLARESATPITAVTTATVSATGAVLAQLTVPTGKVYRLSEISVGGDTANRVDVVIGNQVVHTMFYPAYGMNHKTYAVQPIATAGQTVRVISQLATTGAHTATIIAQESAGE